jgi:hypothetical protein
MSWQRTAFIVLVLAIAALVAIVAPEQVKEFDQWLYLAFGFAGGAAIPTGRGKRNVDGGPIRPHLVALLILPALLVGCANPTSTRMTDGGIETISKATNSARMIDEAGQWQADYVGYTPTQAVIDSTGGVDIQTAGIGTAMNLLGKLNLWTGRDVDMAGVEVGLTPDGVMSFKADRFTATSSTVVKAYDTQLQAIATAIKDMTQAEATRYVDSLVAAGDITNAVADVAMQSLIPLLSP